MFEVGKFCRADVGRFYETVNGSKVQYRGLSWFAPLQLFCVIEGGHGVGGLAGSVAGSLFLCYDNGARYLHGDFRASAEESAAARGMDIKGPWIEEDKKRR
jgi:hypothetical protein